MSIDLKTGAYRGFHLEQFYKDWDSNFRLSALAISENGICYTSDGNRVMAFEVPDKNW